MRNKVFRILVLALAIIMVLPFGISSAFAQEDIKGIDIGYYSVVYSSKASADIKQTVKDFGKYLNTYCNAEVEVIQDVGNKPIKKEIIIGNTNRPAGTDVVLKEKDWYVYTDGTKIYLNAYSDDALPLVIEWFKHNCLINGSRKAYIGDGYFYSHEYDFDGFTIDGALADDLVIAYDNNDHIGFVDAAYTLTYAFMDKNGLPLSVASTSTREEPQFIIASALCGSKYLPEGVTVGSSEYVLCRNGKDIVLVADSSYGAALAVEKIIDMIDAGRVAELTDLCSTTPVSYTVGKDSMPMTEGAEYRVMTYNPAKYYAITEDRCDEVLATMAFYSPDVIGFQEYCDYFARHMTPQLSKVGYTMLGDELTKGRPENQADWRHEYNMTPIAYRTDRFECIASGWQRMENTYDPDNNKPTWGYSITWGILRDKITGEIFGVTNTHFFNWSDRSTADPIRAQNADEILALVTRLRGEYSCPFISLGDYNSWPTDEAYKKLEGSELFRDARNVATKETSITASGHHYKKIDLTSNPAIDHFFITDEISVLRNKIAVDEISASGGDHFPVLIDIVINTDAEPGKAFAPVKSSVVFPAISASEFKNDAANGKTTVGRNNYRPAVEIKTSAPLEADEFWEMKNPPVETPDGDSTPNEPEKQDKGLFGCGSIISGSAIIVIMAVAGLACAVKRKKESE